MFSEELPLLQSYFTSPSRDVLLLLDFPFAWVNRLYTFPREEALVEDQLLHRPLYPRAHGKTVHVSCPLIGITLIPDTGLTNSTCFSGFSLLLFKYTPAEKEPEHNEQPLPPIRGYRRHTV
jgi:hypothetical protein